MRAHIDVIGEGIDGYIHAGDEADELGGAFLDNVFGILGDLCIVRQGLLHDAADARNWKGPLML